MIFVDGIEKHVAGKCSQVKIWCAGLKLTDTENRYGFKTKELGWM